MREAVSRFGVTLNGTSTRGDPTPSLFPNPTPSTLNANGTLERLDDNSLIARLKAAEAAQRTAADELRTLQRRNEGLERHVKLWQEGLEGALTGVTWMPESAAGGKELIGPEIATAAAGAVRRMRAEYLQLVEREKAMKDDYDVTQRSLADTVDSLARKVTDLQGSLQRGVEDIGGIPNEPSSLMDEVTKLRAENAALRRGKEDDPRRLAIADDDRRLPIADASLQQAGQRRALMVDEVGSRSASPQKNSPTALAILGSSNGGTSAIEGEYRGASPALALAARAADSPQRLSRPSTTPGSPIKDNAQPAPAESMSASTSKLSAFSVLAARQVNGTASPPRSPTQSSRLSQRSSSASALRPEANRVAERPEANRPAESRKEPTRTTDDATIALQVLIEKRASEAHPAPRHNEAAQRILARPASASSLLSGSLWPQTATPPATDVDDCQPATSPAPLVTRSMPENSALSALLARTQEANAIARAKIDAHTPPELNGQMPEVGRALPASTAGIEERLRELKRESRLSSPHRLSEKSELGLSEKSPLRGATHLRAEAPPRNRGTDEAPEQPKAELSTWNQRSLTPNDLGARRPEPVVPLRSRTPSGLRDARQSPMRRSPFLGRGLEELRERMRQPETPSVLGSLFDRRR